MKNNWMIYGANGYTGKLLAEEAAEKGYKPLLAGRSSEKLIPIAEQLGFDYIEFSLNDERVLYENLKGYDLILNAAGPFKYTCLPIIKSCLKTGTSYMDITGEVPIFESIFAFNQQATDAGILLLPGVGFDVVPSDCMAKYVSVKIENPTQLDIGVAGLSGLSPGTMKTMIEYLDTRSLIRKNGKLVQEQPLEMIHKINFKDMERRVIPIVWGDLSTAYRSTNIPNITTYMPYPKQLNDIVNSISIPQNKSENNSKSSNINFKRQAQEWIEKNVKGPDENTRLNAKSYIWSRVRNEKGSEAEAWLETIESYQLTRISGIKCVKKFYDLKLKGALTPSLAFGADFILEFPSTNRYDSLDS